MRQNKRLWPLLLITVVAVASCMSMKKQINNVLADPGAKEKVGREWEKANPCPEPPTPPKPKPDTSYLPGDTVVTPGETVYRNDTLFITHPGKTITQKMVIRDTFYLDKTDYRRLGIWQDSVRQYNVWLATEKAEVARLKAEHNHVGTMLMYAGVALLKKWWLWALLLAGAGLWYLNRSTGLLSIFKRKS